MVIIDLECTVCMYESHGSVEQLPYTPPTHCPSCGQEGGACITYVGADPGPQMSIPELQELHRRLCD
jgi:hypothetical protein